MSGLIEKITLYDLLGYAVPGSILLGMSGFTLLMLEGSMKSIYSTYKDAAGYFFTILLILGYAAGMLISEITDFIIGFCQESMSYELRRELKARKLNVGQAEQALKTAGYMKKEEKLQSPEEIIPYIQSMYADIQSDTKYNRLHNYASSKLICKNMAFVLFCAVFLLPVFWRESGIMFSPDFDLLPAVMEIAGLLAAVCLFIRRWKRMYVKTSFYTVVWFIEKYAKKTEKA